MRNVKLAIIGAGVMGSTVTFQLAHEDIFDEITLLDSKNEVAVGQALDIQQSLTTSKTEVTAAKNPGDLKGSEIAIIAAGRPRAPNMSRLDLINSNKEIVSNISKEIAKNCPEASIITVTNPSDVMNYVAWKASGFDKKRVIGSGSNLDTMRLRSILAKRYNVGFYDIDVMTIGEHGDHQIPIFSQAKVKGKKIKITESEMGMLRGEVLVAPEKVIAAKGSTQYAPASSVVDLVLAVVNGTKKPFPCSAILSGEYGYSNVSIGVPVLFKKRRIEKIVEISMGGYETRVFNEGAEKLKEICQGLQI